MGNPLHAGCPRRKPTASAVGERKKESIPLCRRLARRERSERSTSNKMRLTFCVHSLCLCLPFREFWLPKFCRPSHFFSPLPRTPLSLKLAPALSRAEGCLSGSFFAGDWQLATIDCPGTPLCSLSTVNPNPFVPATLYVSTFVCQNLHRVVQQALCFQPKDKK